ncbi:hypothetical protein AZI86_10270 [Bdellovibrio bacteriovorus]|uniref:DUF2239 domain-containing protein n=1 Tax=Bdellovibrio bacteriovorus TaxID=959 RepID=A0A150WSF3_BDEBC|nr:DUF2239 family protein [Bdellovibrio bacteriovorus]KYG67370.1 hypothetical protein AZI86_10270 [Bdellovibrio bacteriovorus]
MKIDRTYSAFAESKKIATGDVLEVASRVKKFLTKEAKAQVLIFDDSTSNQIEIDFRGTPENVTRRLEALLENTQEGEKKSGPGRPKLGVVAKEVTLLPDHWEWLARQPGGASVTLRKLVEEAKKKNLAKDQIRMSQEATYKFMTVMAGDLPDYEEALRALYAGDAKKFEKLITAWPKDIQDHTMMLAKASWK